MKKIFTSVVLILSALTNSRGQITLENINQFWDMNAIRLSAGSKFSVLTNTYDTIPDTLTLYNLNYTLYKSILIPQFAAPNGYRVQYIADALFDTDSSDVEYLIYVQPSCFPNCIDSKIKVIDESGNMLLDLDSAGYGYSFPGMNGLGSLPIVETDSGAKFFTGKNLFWGSGGSESRIYSLPGHLPCNLCGNNSISPVAVNELSPVYEDLLLSNPYPNPANSTIKIEYHLPAGAKTGNITFYNAEGALMKSYSVNRSAAYLILNAKDFAAGTYYYQLMTDAGRSIGKKMLVVN